MPRPYLAVPVRYIQSDQLYYSVLGIAYSSIHDRYEDWTGLLSEVGGKFAKI